MDLRTLEVLLISASPLVELRGAIPFGLSLGLKVEKVLFMAILGNLIPVIPLLFIFSYLLSFLRKIVIVDRFFSWWFLRVERKKDWIERYGFWGLVLFVAIPFPGSGAWSGCLAAYMFRISFKKALLGIILGVILSGFIVTFISTGILNFLVLFKS